MRPHMMATTPTITLAADAADSPKPRRHRRGFGFLPTSEASDLGCDASGSAWGSVSSFVARPHPLVPTTRQAQVRNRDERSTKPSSLRLHVRLRMRLRSSAQDSFRPRPDRRNLDCAKPVAVAHEARRASKADQAPASRHDQCRLRLDCSARLNPLPAAQRSRSIGENA